MWQKLLDHLNSPKSGVRMAAWRQLHERCAASQLLLSRAKRLVLARILDEEPDEGVWRMGVNALLALALGSDSQGAAADREPEELLTLSDWLWDPFHKESAVFATTASGYHTRDEYALIYLARRLGFRDFPRTDFFQFPPGDETWNTLLVDNRYQAICLVGRPGLYGPEAVKLVEDETARFGFAMHNRPTTLPYNKIDADYHRIFERDGDRVIHHRTTEHRTEDGREVRDDFGLVQRFPINIDGHRIVLLICAGASSLGTLGAARWAADHLNRAASFEDDTLLDVPEGTNPDSQLEALLSVTAEVTTRAWVPSRIELLKLYVDRASWTLEERQWRTDPLRKIEITISGGEAVSVLLDGKRRCLPGSKTFNLLVAVALMAKRNNGAIDVRKLAADKKVWGQPTSEANVRTWLRTLRSRYLGDALTNDKDVRLLAEVVVHET